MSLFVVLAAAALAASSCGGSVGGAGEACLAHGAAIMPADYSCSPGLICNAGHYPPFCQVPHAFGVGAYCSQDANCKATLYCQGTCRNLNALGQDCDGPTSCQPGLTCTLRPDGWALGCAIRADAGPVLGDAAAAWED